MSVGYQTNLDVDGCQSQLRGPAHKLLVYATVVKYQTNLDVVGRVNFMGLDVREGEVDFFAGCCFYFPHTLRFVHVVMSRGIPC